MASYLALDIGEKRIGVAVADVSAPFPAPLTTLEASPGLAGEFASLLRQNQVTAVIIGLPRNQSGERTAQTDRVEHIAKLLKIPKIVPVVWQDESLTSVKAEEELSKKKKGYSKGDIDALAATYILDDFLRANPNGVVPQENASQSEVEQSPKSAKKTKKKSKKRNPFVVGLLGLVALIVVLSVALASWYFWALGPRTTEDNYAVITVKSGTGSQQIGQDLESHKLIKSSSAFALYVRLNRITNLQAGAYRISSHQSVPSIVDTITSGKVSSVNVLIAPGQRLDQIIEKLEDAGYTEEELEAALVKVRDHPILEGVPADAPLEGYLFPDTYQIGPDTTAEQLFRLMLDNFQGKVTPEVTNGIKQQGLTFNQAVILASIVQKEVSDASVQPTVAQVFIKRYKEGISLGSDVTSIYGAINDGIVLSKNAAQAGVKAVNHDSPYNTRMHQGLPPTAIANFNLAALRAVANPSSTDYLFFVAGDDGKTYFSRTSAEHDALVAEHCKIQC